MKVLIVYPHGLGDCILATPALRAYKKATGNFVGFAMLERFRSSELFKHNPYIDELVYTKDAWNDFATFEQGCNEVEDYCRVQAREKGYDDVIFVKHSPAGNKILDCATALGVELDDVHTEVYISADDERAAGGFRPDIPYGIVHTHTGVLAKDFPDGWGREFMIEKWGLSRAVEVGLDFCQGEIPIGVQFALLRGAERIVVPDSVFFHAACAMDKPVDFAYFSKGKSVYDRVRPLHKVEHNVVWQLP